MILTQCMINPRRQGTRKLLGSPQAMHAAVLAGFPPTVDPGRVLWRIDGAGTPKTVLWIASEAAPDLTHLEEQAGWPSHPTTRSVEYGPLLGRLAKGQQWSFRLTANPTHRATLDGKKKILAHVTTDQQIAWLISKADALGIRLGEDDQRTFDLVGREVRKFRRQDSTVTLAQATFAGILEVVDPELLRHAMSEGIGRGKAYGCGLLTLAKP